MRDLENGYLQTARQVRCLQIYLTLGAVLGGGLIFSVMMTFRRKKLLRRACQMFE